MIKMKLKIGTIEKKKEKTATIIDNYADDYSDEELEAMSKEVNEPNDFDLTETEEIPEDIKKETEKDIKEAMNGVIIFDEVGISMKYVYKFTELYPKKKIIYHKFITKQFLEWYIKNAKLPLLKKMFIIESEYVNPEQQVELSEMIDKRLQKDIELEDVGTLASPELIEKGNIKLETGEQIDAYEFVLTEKWNADERAKGIQQLDAIIEEQMRVRGFNLNQALSDIIEKFGLTSKFFIEKKLIKTEANICPYCKEEIITTKPKSKKTKKDRSNAEVSKELDRSIKRFHHIKFLYELMSEKMDFIETNPPTIEDIEEITAIQELLYDCVTPTEKKKEIDDHQTIGQMMIDNGFSGGND